MRLRFHIHAYTEFSYEVEYEYIPPFTLEWDYAASIFGTLHGMLSLEGRTAQIKIIMRSKCTKCGRLSKRRVEEQVG